MINEYVLDNNPDRTLLKVGGHKKPIPSRNSILGYLDHMKQGVIFEKIADDLKLRDKEEISALSNRLAAMVRDKQIEQEKRYFRLLDKKSDIVKGYVHIENDGSAIIVGREMVSNTTLLSRSQSRLVFNGDKVSAKILGVNAKGKIEASIHSIIKRSGGEITGLYSKNLDSHFIQPISKTMPKYIALLPPNKKLKINTLIKAKVVIFPSIFSSPVAELVDSIEDKKGAPVFKAALIAKKKHNLKDQWGIKTIKSALKLPPRVLGDEISQRVDLRSLPFITIDGKDSKDFDDAIYVRKSSTDGWKIYVAISDVSYYVRPDSPLDKEARSRSTSIYFPGYVIPMLPVQLCNELCSLKPKVDRLVLVCEMNVSVNAKLSRYIFYSAVINSRERLTYDEVTNLISDPSKVQNNQKELNSHLLNLYALYRVLAKRRRKRGAIEFNIVDSDIILDKNKNIQKIVPLQRDESHKIIEECMILANVAAAKFIKKNKKHAPFRVHPVPSDAKVSGLQDYLNSLGINFNFKDFGKIGSGYKKMLESVKSRSDFLSIQLMTLKSIGQAFYTPNNNGHFGLAYPAYSHFTSPIRRYPDILVHRIIKSIIGERTLGAQHYTHAQLNKLCIYASVQERNAELASSDAEKWLKCYFLNDHINKLFKARVVHITRFGIYIELTETKIEGFIHISSMHDDYYIFDKVKNCLIGKQTNKIFYIGKLVPVKLISVNINKIKIEFELTNSQFKEYRDDA